jgi:TonB-dependent receptor
MSFRFGSRSARALMCGASLAAIASAASAADITGRVTNATTGAALAGAAVRVTETGRQAITGQDGSFRIQDVAPGRATLSIDYAGFLRQDLPLEIGQDDVVRNVGLTADSVPLDEVLVVARRQGQAQAINLQRNADSIRTVVSADALGQIREGNIGDALVRLPGVSVETRAGVQRTATIRGLAPQYNTVTVDGLRMTNVDGNRDIALDSFPSNMLSRVEVIKSPTTAMSADAIGGTVDLISRSAYDSAGLTFEAQVGTTYNDLRDNWNQQAGFTIGDTFGSEGQFGALASIYYWHDERGYDTVEMAYTVGANGVAAINRALYYDRAETKDKIGAGLALDYRPTDATRAFFRALYSYDFRELNRRATDYRPNVATQTGVTADGGASTGARIDLINFYREPKNVFEMYTAGGSHQAGDWAIDGRVAYSKAVKTYPRTLQVTNSINNVALTYDRTVRDFPTFRVDNGVDVTNPALVTFRQYDTSQVPRTEDEWTVDGRVSRDFVIGAADWSIEAGGRASWKDASQSQPDTVRYTGLTGATAESLLEFYENDDFMRASDGRGRLLPFFPDWQAYLARLQSNPGSFTQSAAAALFTAETRANSNFSIGENIYAGYAQAAVSVGPFHVLGGVRIERTEVSSVANRVATAGNVVTVTPVEASNSYTNVLPGIQVRYTAVDDRLVLRAAATTAISRPPPGDLVASRQENAQLNQRIIGNPNLEPAESTNLDFTAEYFFPPLGVLSAGVFYKDIEKFVFSSSRIAADGVDERTRVNGEGGKVRGFEAAWVQQFDFLPGALSGLGVEANFTYLDTDAVYPGRTESLPLVNSPKYILNGIVSYTRGPVDVRLSYNRLPKRLESVGARAALDRYNAAVSILDFAAKVKLGPTYSAFLNIKNLTDEPTVQYQGTRDVPVSVTYYGRQFNFGVNFAF